MCRPTYYTVKYEINPWMHTTVIPTSTLATKQWNSLYDTVQKCGAKIELVDPAPENPDMVFTANAGLVIGNWVYVSNFKFKERKGERPHFKKWFETNGFAVDGDEEHNFEGAGDALFAGKKMFSGYGHRTDRSVYQHISKVVKNIDNAIELVYAELIDPYFYHIDTCFCPIDSKLAIWYPLAFAEHSRKLLEKEIELFAVPKNEAEFFACNSVVIGKNVIVPARCPETMKFLESRGWQCHSVEMTEFLKAGGAAKCLTLAI